jgi:peptide subunit release factor 1 (eRF1)
MPTISKEQVQLLMNQDGRRGMLVSCYADTTVKEGFDADWLQPFKTEATEIRKRLSADHQAKQAVERDLESIRRTLESDQARRAAGMAVFSATGRDFFLALPSDVPFANKLVVGEEPYVVPLLEMYLQQRGYLAVQLDAHRARVYAAGAGGLELLEELDEAVPRKNRRDAGRWVKPETTTERHRKDHILHFHKELADLVEHAWDEQPYRSIILLGEREVLESFRRLLPDRLTPRVVHEAPHAWTEEDEEIREDVRAVIAREQAAQEQRVLAEFANRMGQAFAVAAGPQEVIENLRNGQVAELILEPDAGAVGYRCTNCRSLFAAEQKTCPYCSSTCKASNLWQEILALAMSHGVWVNMVKPNTELARHGGIAALLARDEPQWASATPGASQETRA